MKCPNNCSGRWQAVALDWNKNLSGQAHFKPEYMLLLQCKTGTCVYFATK